MSEGNIAMCPKCGRILDRMRKDGFECGICGYKGLPEYVDEKTAIGYPMKRMKRSFIKRLFSSLMLILIVTAALLLLSQVFPMSLQVGMILACIAIFGAITLDRNEEFFFHSRYVFGSYLASEDNAKYQEKFRKEDIERQKRAK
jgi:hypothetical protein